MKQYNGEKAIISLTSWKERINTVSKTLFSLLQYCPGFHIVLVLSEEEFPQKEKELPTNLRLFIDNDLIEILWVYKNYKAFKKILFTMDKYQDVPIISADDDCIYKFNYAEEWYNKWVHNKNSIICNTIGHKFGFKWSNGPYTLFPPHCFKNYGIENLNEKILKTDNDDAYYGVLLTKLKIPIIEMRKKNIVKFHNEIKALGKKRTTNIIRNSFNIINKNINI